MLTTADIRSLFLNYFGANGHEVVPSASLVPHNDPTLLFTNAGMVPFKNVFTGDESRPYTRAASSQKCVRAGGKHNDLENVGHTARHHTFFEMLGNFSFGDYFKEEAIEFAWQFITREVGLDPKRLVVTHFSEDLDAPGLWKKIAGLNDDRIISIASRDENFWSMGDLGPCGPCSEIFYDHGDHIPGGPPGSKDADLDRYIEIWNLVFMQYQQVTKETRIDLPKPSIDTGMGLERIAAVLQGVHDNYDTDIFKALIAASSELTHTSSEGATRDSHRVIADHLRSSCFLIADGVLPSNEGRGYVLRRIMRRAMRHVQMLGYNDLLMAKLVPTLVEKMGVAYPELTRSLPLIVETLNLEESRFHQTLERGLKLLNEESSKVKSGGSLPGEVAFKLYDTYGFPLDLTADVLRAEGKTVDEGGFQSSMAKQKADARAAWSGSGDTKTEALWFEIKDKVGASEFLGYKSTQGQGVLQALIVDGASVQSAPQGAEVDVIVNQTPFYGESGGQMGDTGQMTTSQSQLEVTDTLRKVSDLIVHKCKLTQGSLTVGDEVHLTVDGERRTLLKSNHSATHLLHKALRDIVGAHVTQKGSLVAPDRLRFDFSHSKPLSRDEIIAVEDAVNAQVRKNSPTTVRIMSPDEAQKQGAMALFGEKYGDEVRVVSMGEGSSGHEFSVELCGGTHVERTGDIGYFKIIVEAGVASGIRRIEALTGVGAELYARSNEDVLNEVSSILKSPPRDVAEKITALVNDGRRQEKELQSLRQKMALSGGDTSSTPQEIETINGISFTSRHLSNVSPKDLKPIVDDLKTQITSGVIVVACSNEGKASLVVGVTQDLVGRLSAVDLIRKATPQLGGEGGGGRPDMAQAGGPDASGIENAIQAVRLALAS